MRHPDPSSAATLIARLRTRGVQLWFDGHIIRWRARRGAMADADLTALRDRKPEVVARLVAETCPLGTRVWIRYRALSHHQPEWREATVTRVWGAPDDPYPSPPDLAGQVMVHIDGMEAEALLSVCQLFRDREEIERCI